MPPRAMQLIGDLVERLPVDLPQLWSSLAPHLASWEVRRALARLRQALEGKDLKPERSKASFGQIAVQGGGQIAACGTKLLAGMRVMLRWRPGSVGATHMAYLNGHVPGTLSAMFWG